MMSLLVLVMSPLICGSVFCLNNARKLPRNIAPCHETHLVSYEN